MLDLGHAIRIFLANTGEELACAQGVVRAHDPGFGVLVDVLGVRLVLMGDREHQLHVWRDHHVTGKRAHFRFDRIAFHGQHQGARTVFPGRGDRVRIGRRWCVRWILWCQVWQETAIDGSAAVRFFRGDRGVDLDAVKFRRVVPDSVRETVGRIAWQAQWIGAVAGNGQVGLETGWRWDAMEGLERNARLLERGQATADAQGTEVAGQADAALALEQGTLDTAGALLDGAGVRLVTDLELENRFQATAQIFGAFEAQGVVGTFADGHGLVGTLDQASVDVTVDND